MIINILCSLKLSDIYAKIQQSKSRERQMILINYEFPINFLEDIFTLVDIAELYTPAPRLDRVMKEGVE